MDLMSLSLSLSEVASDDYEEKDDNLMVANMVVNNCGGGPRFSVRPCLSLLYRSSPHLSLFGICCILGVWWWIPMVVDV